MSLPDFEIFSKMCKNKFLVSEKFNAVNWEAVRTDLFSATQNFGEDAVASFVKVKTSIVDFANCDFDLDITTGTEACLNAKVISK